MATHHHRYFRLRGIPTRYETRIDVRELVKNVLSIEPGASVIIHSLVDNPIEPDSQVATLSFHTLPDDLSDGSRNEWSFNLPTSNAPFEDEFSRMDYLVFDTHFTGFTPLQHTKAENCHVNLIAISGLGGHAFGSFKERGGPFMWLRDVLPFDFPSARILIYGYDTQIEQSVSFQNVADLGKALGIDMKSLRVLDENRAIVFLGHSLGGLVIKQAMINLRDAMDKQSASILHSVSGFLFFGVPHQGMAIESLVPLIENNPNRSLLESLNKNSALLQILESKFSNLFGAEKPEIFSFYETEKSPTAIKTEKGKWELSGPPEVLVDVSSATCGCNERYPINRNHSEMVKYHNRYDGCYIRVRSVLGALLGTESRLAFAPKKGEHSVSLSDEDWETLRSLSFREQESRYLEIHSANETCEWLLQEPQYQTWMNKSHGLFWIKGNPGAGKSVLMKFAVDEMKRSRSGEVVASFFIHGRGVLLQKTPAGVLRALLSSILKHFPADLSRVTKRFRDYQRQFGSYEEGRWDWTIKELEDFMSHTLTKGTKSPATVIFIDALDECGENYARGLFAYFKKLMEVVERKGGQVKICISSRHYPILGLNTIPTISVEERNDTDIRFVVQELLQEIQPRAKREEVEKQILLKAQGGFLWAILVTQRVIHSSMIGTKDKKLFEELTVTPETLDELYTDILKDTTGTERLQMIKLFQWVLFAQRPLSSQELREAIATDRDMACATVSQLRDHDSWIESLNQFEIHVKHITKGLVAFQTRDLWEQYELEGEPWDREAQFIHQSVADYLVKSFLKQHGPSLHANQTPTGAGHFEISRSCLRYIMLNEVLEGTLLSRSLLCANFPLLPYTIRFFFHHIRKVEQEGILQTDLLPLLWDEKAGPSKKIASLWRILDPDSAHTPNGWPYIGATPLHVLVALGSKSAFEAFLQEGPEVDGRDLEGNTPLLLAIRESHLDMALTLVNRSIDWNLQYANGIGEDIRWIDNTDNRKCYVVDINAENYDGDTPLVIALATKEGELILRLIEAGDDFNLPYGETGLVFYAIQNRDNHLFMHLVKKGVQLDGAIYFVVQELSDKGNDDVLEKFLSELLIAGANTSRSWVFNALSEADAHVESDNIDDEYPDENEDEDDDAILLASRRGRASTVSALLSHSVSATYHRGNRRTPLDLAAADGHLDIVRLLLENGADPNAISRKNGQTPLESALDNGDLVIVRLLLENGADPNAISRKNGQTPLESALDNGDLVIVRLLLENGADRNSTSKKNGQTPLELALDNGNLDIVRLLLENGADPNAISRKNGQTPLELALDNRDLDIVRLLLENGAYLNNISSKNKQILLYSAAVAGHLEAVRLLLENGAEPNIRNKYGGTALCGASLKGHIEVVEFLIDQGADLSFADANGLSPLMKASSKGHIRVVEHLLNKTAALNVTDNEGSTALHCASDNGQIQVVRLLLEKGADITIATSTGNTALTLAASNGHIEVVRLLLQKGLAITDAAIALAAPNGHIGVTRLLLQEGLAITDAALALAASNGHFEVVRLLLQEGPAITVATITGNGALASAASNGHIKVVKILLEKGANLNATDRLGRTPLHSASANGHIETTRYLLKTGANPNVTSNDGRTPLNLASLSGQLKSVKLLLRAGADLSIADDFGRTPLHSASICGRLEVVKFLLEKGASLTTIDGHGRTPLSSASHEKYLEVDEFLREQDANFDSAET